MSYSVNGEAKALIKMLLLPSSGEYWFYNPPLFQCDGKQNLKMFVFYILMRKIRSKVLSVLDSSAQHCNAFNLFQLGLT